MRTTLLNRIKRILKNRRLRRMMTRVISVFAALVVFVTTYALVLPAITMEREADCGIEAHQHDASCYELQLVCDIPEDPGHRHDDSCYRAESVLKCVIAAHTHGEACFDEEGNLICELAGHVHDASCYEEERELICGLEESAGHQHDESCYENVLVCGKEVHVHSEGCYHRDSAEEAEEYSGKYDVPEEGRYFEEETVPEEEQENSGEVPEGIPEDEEAVVPAQLSADADPYETDGSSGAETGEAGADRQDAGGSHVQAGSASALQGGADAGGLTADPAQAASPETPDAAPYVPDLDPLDFRALLNSNTGIYYYPVQPGEIVENSAEITGWKKVTADTELGENDLLRVYLAYTVPAGAVNTTNETVRYRLPENLRLTDEQVKAINGTENGIAAKYVDYSTLTVTDPDNYHKYLGAEAVEGSRTPDQDQEAYLAAGGADGNGQEFISAVVRVENIWDSNSGERIGQDLLFTFVPYTVFKNRHEYDSVGQQTKEGLKVRGWFSLDFNMSQVDFEEPFADGDREILSAGVVFADEDREEQIEEIRTDLCVVRAAKTGIGAEENPENPETAEPENPGTAAGSMSEEENAEGAENAKDAEDEENAEDAENAEDTPDGSEAGEGTEKENKDPENDVPAVIMPAMSFEDSIRVSTGRPVGAETKGAGGTVADAADALPKKAKVTVRVEADEGTFPAGTTMVLAAVKDMETIAETVRDTVENGSAAGTDSGSADEGKASGSGESADSTGSTDNRTAGTGNLKTYGFQAVDISFHDADGNEIEPAKPVRVAMTSEIVDQVRQEQQEDPGTAVADPVVVHIDDNGNVETMDLVAPEEIEPAQGRTEEELREEAEAEAAARRAEEEAEAEVAAGRAEEKTGTEDPQGTEEEAEKETEDKEAVDKEERKKGEADPAEGPDKASADTETKKPGNDGTSIETSEFENRTTGFGQEKTKTNTNTNTNTDPESGISRDIPSDTRTVAFETGAFSVYVIVYTVDFAYSVNGKTYQFSLPGGGFTTLYQLVEMLGISEDENDAEHDEHAAARIADDADVTDATRKFVADVANVAFSDPKLVDISRVENETTVGQIKDSRRLECVNSAELTQEQISKINSTVIESGDWALISMLPFTTEETLTVTMKNGEVFTIRVTDYQIKTKVLTADGITFTITATFDDAAEIPEGTKLEAEEIEYGSDEYLQYLGRTWSEVNRVFSESKERSDDTADGRYMNVNAARFFDISLVYEGKEIEPKAPVRMEITYVKGLASWDNTKPGVVHFTQENGIEILEEVETEVENEAAVSFRYVQDSFSVIGTYIQQETHDAETPPRGALSSDGARVVKRARSAALADGAEEEVAEENPVLTLAPVDLRSGEAAESPAAEDDSGLPHPQGDKSLTPNDDGTYTLTLSLRGSSQSTIKKQQKKANVLFVMDRSSSMITNTVDDEEKFWYYGTADNAEFRQDIGDPNHNTGKNYQFYGVVNGEYVELNANFSDWSHVTFTYWDGTYDSVYYYPYQVKHYVNYPSNGKLYVRSKTTRLYAEQDALNDVIGRLLAYNTDVQDEVEVAVISFADHRADTKGWTDTEYTDWVTGTDKSNIMNAVNSTRYASGTNWEEALKYAHDIISAKKSAEAGKPEEEYYVVFLTDGEPTNIVGDTSAAAHTGDAGNKDAYDAAKDDALALVRDGYKFYNIFTYRKSEPVKYSKYLTNYAYSNGTSDYNENETEYVNAYFSDAKTIEALNDTFNNIFQTIADIIGHAEVSITDTLTTDAMTTTIVEGQTNGYEYTVRDPSGTVLYTVTATGEISAPVVTFHVPGSATKTYTGRPVSVGDGTLYSITTAEGVEYRMALADIDDETGELTWDLAPVGILMDNCEYSVSFIVWPDQEAYNYVAGLNNKLPGFEWKTTLDTYEDLTDTKGYEIGGVEGFPSIVKYADGTFAVLTNKDQKLHYSVVEMETVNGEPTDEPVIHGPYYEELPQPRPMELTATETELEKAWSIDRSPSTLAAMLYDEEGNPTKLHIDYDIKVNGATEPYTTLKLGWDDEEGKYMWDTNSIRNVTMTGTTGSSVTVPVGTRWSKDFAIATGLMLSEARMDALHMDKDAYDCYSYGTTKYYILETGNDYTIEERIPEDASRTAYEFDVEAPVYHPMLVDGRLKSVTFNRNASEEIISIKDISKEDWMLSLKIENVLRGYIRLEKRVVDKDGKTPQADSESEFKYRIELKNTADPGPFTVEGSHIPWYGIDGLYYHSIDENGHYHYYQAETNSPTNKAHSFILTTESGEACPAECVDPDAEFDEDVPGPTLIKYVESGVEKQIELYGNQLEHESDNFVYAELEIRQGQLLYIANVPTRSTYKIVETNPEGYEVVSIRREIRNGDSVESGSTFKGTDTVSGTIVADRDNHIIYTNKPHSVDLTLKKTDENGLPLPGAVFSLYKKDGDTWSAEPLAAVPGEEEKDTATYEFINLADGSYKLVETPPAGYAAVDDVFFTVANGVLSIDGTLPAGVTMNGDKLLLTVQNAPRTDSLTVRKQWLDVNGIPREPGTDDIAITLKRTVDVPQSKTLHVVVQVRNNSNNGYRVKVDQYWPITNESAIVSWYDNSQYSYDSGRVSVTASSGLTSVSQTATGGRSSRAIFKVSNLENAPDTPTITFSYTRSSESWIYDQINSFNIEGSGNSVQFGGVPEEDDWSQTIHLNDGNKWSSTLTGLPVQDGSGNAYHYYIVEEELEGYTVTYSDNNVDGTTTGVLTAYNQRTSEDVTVSVKKVWEDGTNEDGTPTEHQPSLDVTLSNGRTVTLDAHNQWQATISGLPKYDHDGEEIEYTWTEASLTNGYYQSGSKALVYDDEIITTLTNSYSEHYMPEMEIDGVKIWDDGGNTKRPESITVNLYKDGAFLKATTVASPADENADSDHWAFRFTNLPVFAADENGNATGTLAVYTVEEVLPAGSISDYETAIQQITATYTAGTAEAHIINSYTPENQLISEGADLGFVVVRHGQDYVVWTPRPLGDGELEKIKAAAKGASNQFSGIMSASGDSFTIISGVPKTVSVGNKEAATVYMKDGDVWVRFKKANAQSDLVYGSIPYTYTQIGGEGGVTITNTGKTTTVSGTKTWVDGGRAHANSDEIVLKLYRRPVTSESEADWEEVVESPAVSGMTLTWEGNAYTFSNLPRYVDITADPPVEYEYRVEEVSVIVRDENQQPVQYLSEANGNDFINTELIHIEAVKTWKQGDDVINDTIAGASATFELQRKNGDHWEKVEQTGLTNPLMMSVGETPDVTAWRAAWNNLPGYTLVDSMPALIEYRVVETEAWLYGGIEDSSSGESESAPIRFDVKPEGTAAAAGTPLNIDNTLPDIGISVTKQWKDGTAVNADRVFDEAKTINFTLYQKGGEGEGRVYSAFGTNGQGTVTYTPEDGETAAFWSTVEIGSLPGYVYDGESGTWNEAAYYVVEEDPGGVTVTYQSDGGEAVDAGEDASAADGSTITIINTDALADLTILKVDSNGMTTPLKGAAFTIQQIDETKSVLSLHGDPVTAATTGGTAGETGTDGVAGFTDLRAGYYIVKETKIPAGYVQTGDGCFYIKIDGGIVTLVERKADGGWQESAGTDKLLFTAAAGEDPATATVGNDSGAALPNSGGSGTRVFTIFGSILIAGAGLLLWRRRRLI